jgi:hypothetical protein
MIAIFLLLLTLPVVLASSTSGDQNFYGVVTLFRPPPLQVCDFCAIWVCISSSSRSETGDARKRLVAASPVMTKNRAPAGGNNNPENGLAKPPRRDTRAISPAGIFGGKAPHRLAAQKSRLHAPSHQCPCAARLLTTFANGQYKLD